MQGRYVDRNDLFQRSNYQNNKIKREQPEGFARANKQPATTKLRAAIGEYPCTAFEAYSVPAPKH